MFVPVVIRAGRVEWEPFERFAASLNNMSEPLKAVGDRLLASIGQQFATEGGWGGRPWKALSPGYRRWKETRVPGLSMLVGIKPSGGERGHRGGRTYSRSGKMRAELLAPHGYMVTSKRMAYTPTSEIAGLHQEGTIGKGGHMPERPPVVIPWRELDEWQGVFVGWVDTLIERLAA